MSNLGNIPPCDDSDTAPSWLLAKYAVRTYLGVMANLGLIGAASVSAILGCSRREVTRLVERGVLEPAMKLDGLRGAYLFDPDVVAALAAERAPQEATA